MLLTNIAGTLGIVILCVYYFRFCQKHKDLINLLLIVGGCILIVVVMLVSQHL